MGRVETFDHTADLGLRIVATDLDDLFRSAAEGLFDVIVANRDQVRQSESERISLAADSLQELLLAWLSELIFRCETEHRLYTHFEVVLGPEGRHLEATIHGESIDSNRHILDHEVKAVTHHQLRLIREADAWVAEVILDI